MCIMCIHTHYIMRHLGWAILSLVRNLELNNNYVYNVHTYTLYYETPWVGNFIISMEFGA